MVKRYGTNLVWLFRLGNGAIHLGDEPDPRCPRVGI